MASLIKMQLAKVDLAMSTTEAALKEYVFLRST
jgi:hypothetical protein